MADTSELKIITDETLMEKRTHGQSVFPFQYYLEDIWDFDFHTIGWHWHQEIEFIYVQSGEVECYIGKDNFSLPAGSGLFINTKIIHQLTAKQTTLMPGIAEGVHFPEVAGYISVPRQRPAQLAIGNSNPAAQSKQAGAHFLG